MSFFVESPLCGGRWLGKDKKNRWQWGEFLSRKRFPSKAEADDALREVIMALFGDVKIKEEL